MSTHDLVIANDTMPNVRSDLNSGLQALGSQMAGTADPATMYAYERQARTDLGIIRRRNAANTGWLNDGTLAETFVVARGSNTILGQADFKRVFRATAAFTQTLTAAATLGDGWYCGYNAGGYAIVLDPNSSETIDGSTTKTVTDSGLIFCDGTGFYTIGFSRSWGEAIMASLGADVSLNNTSNYFDGPSVAQGTVGKWFASGQVTVGDPSVPGYFSAKLWDGTNIISTAFGYATGASLPIVLSLSGFISAPAGNIRISARAVTATTGKIYYNASSLGQDSTVTALRYG